MPVQHFLILLMILCIWGINFLFMKWSVNEISPIMVGMLRFFCVVFPLIFLLKKPKTSWKYLILYGLIINFGAIVFMYLAISWQFPTGLSALIVQAQVFLTVILAFFIFGESVKLNQIFGMLCAGIGLLLIGIGQYQGKLPLLGLIPLVISAVFSAGGNIIVKKIGNVDALSLVVWGSLSSFVAFLCLALTVYGVDGVVSQTQHLTWRGWTGIVFSAYLSSVVGYAIWGFLLVRYSASQITPFALLIPVIALLVGFVFLAEKLGFWHWLGIIAVMLGLYLHLFCEKLFAKKSS